MDTITDIIADISAGKMVIIMDDEERENEGDLLMAASCVQADDINFMARYGRGLICLTLTEDRCDQLGLKLMVTGTKKNHHTNFTVPIEAATGVTTGISAADRATTIQAAIAAAAQPSDIVQPGHVFPLMCQPGGVLSRAGHTEAGSDLAQLAGYEPASVIVEILNEDGTMARRPQLEEFAQQHGLRIGTIADLISYRLEHEKTIVLQGEKMIDTEFGCFRLTVFKDSIDHSYHLALVYGEINKLEPVLVRVHIQDVLTDVLAIKPEHNSWPLREAMRVIVKKGQGIIVLLRKPEHDVNVLEHIIGKVDQSTKESPVDVVDQRLVGAGSQILAALGAGKLQVMGAPKKFHGLSGFGLEVDGYLEYEEG